MAELVVRSVAASRTAAADRLVHDLVQGQGFSHAATRAFYLMVMRQSATMNCPQAATWCLDHLQRNGHELDRGMINTVINTHARIGDIGAAERYWQVMQAAGLTPNIVTFNTMVNACAQGRDAERAEWWFHNLLAFRMRPNRISYGTVIGAYAKVGDVRRAELWADRMSEAGILPDEVVFNSLINACAKAGMQQKAEKFLRTMLSRDILPNQKTYNSLIQVCINSGDLSVAESWFYAMKDAGCLADVITFSSMIYVAAKAGNALRAEHWMRQMVSQNITPNVVCFNTLLHAFARRGAYKRAVEWESRMRRRNVGTNDITFNTMIHASLTGGRQVDTEQWLQRMIQSGFHPDNFTLATLSRNIPLGARRSASEEETTTVSLEWAYEVIARAYEEAGDPRRAGTWRDRARGAPGRAEGAAAAWPGQEGGLADSPRQPPALQGPRSGARWGAAASGVRGPPGDAASASATAAAGLGSPGPRPRGPYPAVFAPGAWEPRPEEVPYMVYPPLWEAQVEHRSWPSRDSAMACRPLAEPPWDDQQPPLERPGWRQLGVADGPPDAAQPEQDASLADRGSVGYSLFGERASDSWWTASSGERPVCGVDSLARERGY